MATVPSLLRSFASGVGAYKSPWTQNTRQFLEMQKLIIHLGDPITATKPETLNVSLGLILSCST